MPAMKTSDIAPLARVILMGMATHENSYHWDDSDPFKSMYTKTEEQSFTEAADGNGELGEFARLAAHWSNDMLAWIEINLGLILVRENGIPIVYEQDVMSKTKPGFPGTIRHKKGDPMMANGKPMERGGTLVIKEVEPGEEAYTKRNNLTYPETDSLLLSEEIRHRAS